MQHNGWRWQGLGACIGWLKEVLHLGQGFGKQRQLQTSSGRAHKTHQIQTRQAKRPVA